MSRKISFIFLLFLSCVAQLTISISADDTFNEKQAGIVKEGNLVLKKGSPLVLTVDGPLRGKVLTSINSETVYYSFRGIRFSRPVQRFQPPQEPETWKEVKDAIEFGSQCPQVDIMTGKLEGGDEDCLFLNVYVPNNALDDPKTDLPVMFWIHGGGFLDGAGSFFGADYFMEESSVILVTVNYRLGFFGFLDIEGVVPGNNGLRDIIQGLKWVQKNIRAFHGDPSRVTIFGESAGGCATHLIAQSLAAKGLFHAAIAQSGNALCPWCLSTPTSQAEVQQRLSAKTKCSNDEPRAFAECLKSADVSIMCETLAELSFGSEYLELLVAPTIEKAHADLEVDLIVSSPPNVIQNENEVEKVPIIFGINEEEGLLHSIAFLTSNGSKIRELSDNWNDFAPGAIGFRNCVPKDKQVEVSEKLRQFYFGGPVASGGAPEISRKNIGNLTALFSDYLFYRGTYQSALMHARAGNPVYLYILKYMGDYSIAHSVGYPSTKPSHADDLKFLFPSLHNPLQKHWPDMKKGSGDEDFSKRFVKLWASFANNLEPKTEATDQVSWSPISFFPGDEAESDTERIQWLTLHENFEMVEESVEISRRIKFLDKLFTPYEKQVEETHEKNSKTEL